MRKKRPKEGKKYWQHRPGYNWLLGYYDNYVPRTFTWGIPETYIDRSIKDGQKQKHR